MKQKEITKILNKVYPLIIQDIIIDRNSKIKNVYPEIEFYKNIYERLSGISAMEEHESFAEYHWDTNKIYLYTDNLNSEEDIIRSLIHECVHSTQSYELYEAYYECDLDYETHPYEIEAEHEEENWKKYNIKQN